VKITLVIQNDEVSRSDSSVPRDLRYQKESVYFFFSAFRLIYFSHWICKIRRTELSAFKLTKCFGITIPFGEFNDFENFNPFLIASTRRRNKISAARTYSNYTYTWLLDWINRILPIYLLIYSDLENFTR
jgi:hypothetical protein